MGDVGLGHRVISTVGRLLPDCPHEQTLSCRLGMSERCQQATLRLFNYFVSSGE